MQARDLGRRRGSPSPVYRTVHRLRGTLRCCLPTQIATGRSGNVSIWALTTAPPRSRGNDQHGLAHFVQRLLQGHRMDHRELFHQLGLDACVHRSQSTDHSAAGLVNRHWATRDVAITRSWVGSSTVYGSLRDPANSEPVDFRMTRSVSPPTTHSPSLSTVTAAMRTS